MNTHSTPTLAAVAPATTCSLPAVVYVVATGGFRIAIECEYPLPLEGVCARAIERFLAMGAPPLGSIMEITECSDRADASDPMYVHTESQLQKVGRFSEANVQTLAPAPKQS